MTILISKLVSIVMESSKKIRNIFEEINVIYLDYHKKQTFEKKLETYKKVNLLIDEATKLIGNLQNEIQNLDKKNLNGSQTGKINELIDLLTNTNMNMNPNFNEVQYIVEQLYGINSELPHTVEFIDDINKQIIYESNN